MHMSSAAQSKLVHFPNISEIFPNSSKIEDGGICDHLSKSLKNKNIMNWHALCYDKNIFQKDQ